jgi:hypothetical protein
MTLHTSQASRCFCVPGQRLIQIAVLASMLALGTTTIHVLQKNKHAYEHTLSTNTLSSHSPVSGQESVSAHYVSGSGSSLSSQSSSSLNLFEEWKTALGCDDTTIQVCQDKIQIMVEKQAADLKIWEKRVQAAQNRTVKTGSLFQDYESMALMTGSEHPALDPLIPEYQPVQEWSSTSFPNLNVVGLAKTGTSQLYKILTSHAGTVPFAAKKEHCMQGAQHISWDVPREVKAATDEDKRTVQANLYEYHEKSAAINAALHGNTGTSKGHWNSHSHLQSVNGCLNLHDLWLHLHYIPPTNAKFFLLLRDPADWLWAGFNFWVGDLDIRFAHTQKDKLWASAKSEYRSPELFHELIVSGHATTSGSNLLEKLRRQTVTAGRRIVDLVGRENVLFLRNEDMLPENIDQTDGMLDQIANFTGLERSKFTGPVLHTMMNCNDNKGFSKTCQDDVSSRGAYAIAGDRHMLEKTRAFIYLHYQEECQIWAKEFGVVYPDCVNVLV